jgi:hypothetical protein
MLTHRSRSFSRSSITWCLLCLAALSMAPSPAAAQVKAKWQYAVLSFEESASRDYGSVARWTAGSKILAVTWGRDQPHPFMSLNKQLGGPEPNATLGVLLDRIGQDGWELVSHTSVPNNAQSTSTTQTWTFKRQAN